MRTRIDEFTFEYKGKQYTCECRFKSGLRRCNVRVSYQRLLFSAPYSISTQYIKDHILDLSPKFLARLDVKEDTVEDGYIYLLGKKRKIAQASVEHDVDAITYVNEKDLNRKIKSTALMVYEKEIRKYESIMNITNPYKVSVRDMKTRYGTNSRRTHTICLSQKLIQFDLDIIDSVVVHELAHHFYFDHSHNFYDIVFKYCPKYKQLKKQLRKGVMIYDNKNNQ